jgi:hypothetical protein
MGHVADIRQPTSHDDSGSYGGGDSEVKMIRLATSALRRPPRGNETRGGASSQEAHAGSRPPAGPHRGAGSPRDGWENFARPDLGDWSDQAGPESWDFDESEQDFGEKRNPPKPHASP